MISPTLILNNGRFHTLAPNQPPVTAVAIHHGRFIAAGRDADVLPLAGPETERVDLAGRCVTPGLVDAHVHFQSFALSRRRLDLSQARSLDDALDRIAAFLAAAPLPGGAWLQGRGWNQANWPGGRFPTAAQLDRLAPHAPACLRHHSGHAAWVNARALAIAGVTAQTPDPPGGRIQRDENGRPTGILFEDAIDLVADHIPAPTLDEIVDAMRAAQAYCWQVGLTGLHDFDGRACFQALQTLRAHGELGLRVLKNIPVARLEHALGVGLRSGFGDDWLRIGGVKIFADGALGPRTAAMVAPYEGEPDNRGIVVTDKEEMLAYAARASAAGLSVTVHAIGDRANHDVLDVFELVRGQEQARAGAAARPRLRHRIEHVQLLHPADLQRLAALDVIASMQPTHAVSDMETADRYWGARVRYGYAWRTVLDSGALLVFGSDAPIEAIDPLPGICAAVTRRRPDGAPGPDGWYPAQRLSAPEAVYAFTRAAALTAGVADRFGAIAPGMAADLTIFDRDLFAVPSDELRDVTIAGTLVDGVFRYRTW